MTNVIQMPYICRATIARHFILLTIKSPEVLATTLIDFQRTRGWSHPEVLNLELLDLVRNPVS